MRWAPSRVAFTLVTAAVVCALGCSRASAKPVVLFDESHGQRFLVGASGPLDLSALGSLFRDQGWEVATGQAALADDRLARVDAIVVSGAFMPLAPSEIDAVVRFLERGGRLCVMLHIGPPVDGLLYRLEVAISNGVMRERRSQPEQAAGCLSARRARVPAAPAGDEDGSARPVGAYRGNGPTPGPLALGPARR